MFERSEFVSDPGWTEHRRFPLAAIAKRGRRQRGRLFFAYFLLAKQKKVSSRRATPGKAGELLSMHKRRRAWTPDQAGR